MTKLEYFKLIEGAVNNNILPCYNSDGLCLYRGDNGKKCIFGLLIPDENYTPGMENATAFCLVKSNPGLFNQVDGLTAHDYNDLQMIHDYYSYNPWNKVKFLDEVKEFLEI